MSTNFAAKLPALSTCNHTFLMAEGRWKLQGHWLLQPHGTLIPVHGKLMVVWNSEEWFSLVGKISALEPFTADSLDYPTDITLQYRGYIGASEQRYTYVLQHSHLGQIEGEGWLMPQSIVQQFWILSDRDRRTGSERLYQIDSDHYYWSSSLMTGHSLTSTLEATLERYR
jgi:hypothetical protein